MSVAAMGCGGVSSKIFSSEWRFAPEKQHRAVAKRHGLYYQIAKIIIYIHCIYLRSTPHPVIVTTRISIFLRNPYKPLFVTAAGWGVDPNFIN